MAIFGENERARGEVSIRNLQTREQQAVPARPGRGRLDRARP